MAKMDKQIWDVADNMQQNGSFNIKSLYRFLDDIFSIFIGSTKKLHQFLEQINKLHPHMKFTMQHTTLENENINVNVCPLPLSHSSTLHAP